MSSLLIPTFMRSFVLYSSTVMPGPASLRCRVWFAGLTILVMIIPCRYMQATTIKLDPQLHSTIRKLKPRDQTLTGFVRDLVAREEKRRALESAADAYASLVAGSKDEAAWLASWEAAPLAESPKHRKP